MRIKLRLKRRCSDTVWAQLGGKLRTETFPPFVEIVRRVVKLLGWKRAWTTGMLTDAQAEALAAAGLY